MQLVPPASGSTKIDAQSIMDRRRENVISILNNDDHPSFAVRRPESLKNRQLPPSSTRQPLHLWSPRSSAGYHGDEPLFSPGSPSYPHHLTASHQSSPLTLSPEPSYYSYNQSSQPRSVAASYNSHYSSGVDKLSIQSLTHPYSSQPERVSPQPSVHHHHNNNNSNSNVRNTNNPTNKKNKYPCPYAASHGCGATFTTSGHAARHGKKHTGEKSVICPICNKAFTRKDNMKQHKRTHRNAIAEDEEEYTTRKQQGETASLSHSDADTPPTPASDRSSSRRTGHGPYTLNADEAARRLRRGGDARHGLDTLAIAAAKSNDASRRRR